MAEEVPAYDPAVGAPEGEGEQPPESFQQQQTFDQGYEQTHEQSYDHEQQAAAPVAAPADDFEAKRAKAAALAAQLAAGHTSHESAYDQDDMNGKRRQSDGNDDEPGAKRAAYVGQVCIIRSLRLHIACWQGKSF